MSLLMTKQKAAEILGKQRAVDAGQDFTGKKPAGKTVKKAAAKLGHYGGEETAKEAKKHKKGKKK